MPMVGPMVRLPAAYTARPARHHSRRSVSSTRLAGGPGSVIAANRMSRRRSSSGRFMPPGISARAVDLVTTAIDDIAEWQGDARLTEGMDLV